MHFRNAFGFKAFSYLYALVFNSCSAELIKIFLETQNDDIFTSATFSVGHPSRVTNESLFFLQ